MTEPKPPVTKVTSVVEVQINIVPRGKSTAHMTMVTLDGEIHPFSVDLTDEQLKEARSMVKRWMEYQTS